MLRETVLFVVTIALAIPVCAGPDTISYQGRLLNPSGEPVPNGAYQVRFKFFQVETGGTSLWQETKSVVVTGGAFSTSLGDSESLHPVFMTHADLWLEIMADVDGSGSLDGDEVFSPRQRLNGSPWATPRVEPNETSPNLIGGYSANATSEGIVGATIGGGGTTDFVGFVGSNRIGGDYGTVGGGAGNAAANAQATVAGGLSNTAGGTYAFVGGGWKNTANGTDAAVAGGLGNAADGAGSAIAGGEENTALGGQATVAGGRQNTAIGSFATVAGGDLNTASGAWSFAAGRRAKAKHTGAFVWADSTNLDFSSDRNDQFKIRASGGAYIVAQSHGLIPAALHVESTTDDGVAIHAVQNSSDATLVVTNRGSGDLIRAFGTSNAGELRFVVEQNGNVAADGNYFGAAYLTGSADFAEMLPAVDGLEPGDVLVVGVDGKLTRSSGPRQRTVVGVHSTKPGFLGGVDEGPNPAGKVPLAVVGIVPAKVSAENGPVRPGDLLVTASKPGHGMRGGTNPANGTVIGKALSGLEEGTGVIRMLVMLQ